MAHTRTKMVGTVDEIAPPESDVGKVQMAAKNNTPLPRRPGQPNERKPEVNGIDLNSASLGELTKLYEAETAKPGGVYSHRARLLRAAMTKVEEAEGALLSRSQELELAGKVVSRRVPLSDRVRRKIVDVVEANLDSSVPKFQLRAAAIGSQLIRIEQADEHHAEGETVKHVVETADERRSRLSALARKFGVGQLVVDVAPEQPGGDPAGTDELPNAEGTSPSEPV